jgi:hypothetical protein
MERCFTQFLFYIFDTIIKYILLLSSYIKKKKQYYEIIKRKPISTTLFNIDFLSQNKH